MRKNDISTVGYIQCQVVYDINGNIKEYLFSDANKFFEKIIGIQGEGNLYEKLKFVFPEIFDLIVNQTVFCHEMNCFSIYSNKWYKVKIVRFINDYFFLYFYHTSRPNPNIDETKFYEIINRYELNAHVLNQVYPEDRVALLAEYHHFLETSDFNLDYRKVSLEGEIKWMRSKSLIIEDQVVIVSEDITTEKNQYLNLLEKERMLSAIVYATNELLTNSDYIEAIKTSLTIIGKALGLDQIKLFEVDESRMAKQLFIWSQDISFNTISEFQMLKEYYDIMCRGEIVNELVKDSSDEAKAYLEYQDHLAILMIPIQMRNKLWGFVSYEECKYETLISEDKLSLLKLFTGSIGKAIERKIEENDKEFLSYHDSLTGLYNRRYYDHQFKLIDKPYNLPFSIIVADVNGLKLVNDAFGHLMGDRILKEAADVFKTVCGPESIIARWGGDEFLILLPRTDSEHAQSIVKQILEVSSKRKIQSITLSISAAFDTKTNHDIDITKILKNAEDMMYKQKLVESSSTRSKTVHAIIHALHEKNQREEQHSKRVSEISVKIGIALNLSEMAISKLKAIGLLHDIGKIALSESLLNKPDQLTPSEWNEMKRHSEIGYRILSSSHDLKEIAEYVLHHHERLDGMGYPNGLKGDEIPLYSRIIAVADAYDAMTSDRPYRNTLTIKKAIRELIKHTCTHFDVNIVRVLIEKVLNMPMYKVIRDANHTFLVKGEKFDPIDGITVKDHTDPNLSLDHLIIQGEVNEQVNGNYKLIYQITNAFGEQEKIERIITVGKLLMFPYNDTLIENNSIKLLKTQLDSAIFNITNLNDQMFIELHSGGISSWSAQVYFKGIKFEKGITYIISFDAKAEIVCQISLNIGWFDYNNYIWNSFIENYNNRFSINSIKQKYTFEFTMDQDTYKDSELKFEFGGGDPNKFLYDNILISKKD